MELQHPQMKIGDYEEALSFTIFRFTIDDLLYLGHELIEDCRVGQWPPRNDTRCVTTHPTG
jgi:hypothetical protein